MARPRCPAPFAILQVVGHSLSLTLCIATIGAAGYVASFGFGFGGAMASTFVAAIWTVGVDIAEIAGLSDNKRRVRRLPDRYLWLLEIVTTAVCVILPIFLYGLSGFTHGCDPDVPLSDCPNGERIRPTNSGISLAVLFMIAVAVLHFIFSILSCIQWLRSRAGRTSKL